MLHEYKTPTTLKTPCPIIDFLAAKERLIVARFLTKVEAFGPLTQSSPSLQARLLEEVKNVAQRFNVSAEQGVASGYGRRVLYEEPDRWSLAAIIMRPGQHTELHDHASWGCAITVQGVECDRRFTPDETGNLVLSGQRDYAPGMGYIFDPVDIHQPIGADPNRITVALHFLVHDNNHHNSNREVIELARQNLAIAA